MSHWPQPYPPGPPSPTYVYLPPVHRSSTVHLAVAWLAAVLTAGYFLPWAIGATRDRTNCVATALVNLFFGWTLIGWVIALVMACGAEPVRPVVVQTFPPQPYVPVPYALPPTQPSAAEVTMPLPAYRPGAADHRRPTDLR